MSDLPTPLVPAEVDLRDFGFLPLDVVRLRDSDLALLASGDGFRAAVLLWCVAWHQSPAASLPDDDRLLASYVGYGRDLKGWQRIRAEALRGFILCSDGRLYHSLLADKAREAWASKLARKARTAAATAARQARQGAEVPLIVQPGGGADAMHGDVGGDDQRNGPRDIEPDDRRNDRRNVDRDDPRDVHQGTGKGQGELKKESPKRAPPDRTRKAYPEDFERFWSAYPTDPNMSKSKAGEAWGRLSDVDRLSAGAAVPGFLAHCRKDPTYRPVHAVRFLTERRFDGFLTAKAATAEAAEVPRVDLGPGVIVPEATVVDVIRRGGWIDQWGPRIGKPGCRVPDRIIELARGTAA